jgi:predicted type IV restriction endonuclease
MNRVRTAEDVQFTRIEIGTYIQRIFLRRLISIFPPLKTHTTRESFGTAILSKRSAAKLAAPEGSVKILHRSRMKRKAAIISSFETSQSQLNTFWHVPRQTYLQELTFMRLLLR